MTPSGPSQTPDPNCHSFGFHWEQLNRWNELLVGAAHELGTPFGKPHLAPQVLAGVMKAMAAVETHGSMVGDDGKVIERDDGFGDGLSISLLQVKPKIEHWVVPDADSYTPQGNIRLGTGVMANEIRNHGLWDLALTKFYFPFSDPLTGTTPDEYAARVQNLLAEMGVSDSVPKLAPFGPSRVPRSAQCDGLRVQGAAPRSPRGRRV
jgi:hypothetical protein